MPSPLGHAFGGLAVAWMADLIPGARAGRTAPPTASLFRRAGGPLTLVCVALGAAPDLDLSLVTHRTVTHSVTAVVLVTIVAMVVTGWVTRQLQSSSVVRVALMCGAAYASHLLLDWLGVDRNPPRGIQALWPFSQQWFISGWDVFIQTERRSFFTWRSLRTNLAAMAWETLLLLPVLAAIWLVRVKALAGLAPELPRGHHPS